MDAQWPAEPIMTLRGLGTGECHSYRLHVSKRLLGQSDGPMLEALHRLNGGTIQLPGRIKDRPDRGRLVLGVPGLVRGTFVDHEEMRSHARH